MPSVLLLYADPAVRRVLAAHRPGRLVLASDDVTDADRAVYDACISLPPVWDVEGTVAALSHVRADRVFFHTEFGLPPGCLLASRWGAIGPSPDAVHRCLNKFATRVTLAAAGVPVPKFALASSASHVRASGIGFPLVLKPVASTLGRLVARVDRDDDLDAAVGRLLAALPSAPDVRRLADFTRLARIDPGCDPLRQFLVESYAEGPPREADGLVVGRRIDLFGVTDQRVHDGPGFYIEAYLFPSEAPGRLPDIARAAVRAVGLEDSGFSIEFRGETVIEVNGRLGEDDGFPDLFHLGLGHYPVLRQILGDDAESRATGHHALAYLNRYARGVVRAVHAPPGTTPLVTPGQRLFAPGESAYRAHVAYALASHPESAGRALDLARARLRDVRVDVDEDGAP